MFNGVLAVVLSVASGCMLTGTLRHLRFSAGEP